MKIMLVGARILLGVIFFVFGLNGFYTFIPVPELHPFMKIMVSSGFIYFEKAIEVVGGLLLLINRYVLAALLLLGPVVVNILLYHVLIDQRNWPVALLNLLLYGILIGRYWSYFKIFLKPEAEE